MAERIYLDNASTTFPKSPCVPEAVCRYMTQEGTNVGRGDYSSAYDVEDMVFETRELLCKTLGGQDPSQVVFTRNVTEALNLVLRGFLRAGGQCSRDQHEAQRRHAPLTQLRSAGVTFTRVTCAQDGSLPPPPT